jgi:hypothetical protein
VVAIGVRCERKLKEISSLLVVVLSLSSHLAAPQTSQFVQWSCVDLVDCQVTLHRLDHILNDITGTSGAMDQECIQSNTFGHIECFLLIHSVHITEFGRHHSKLTCGSPFDEHIVDTSVTEKQRQSEFTTEQAELSDEAASSDWHSVTDCGDHQCTQQCSDECNDANCNASTTQQATPRRYR